MPNHDERTLRTSSMDELRVRGDAAMDDLREIVASMREHATSMRNQRPWILALRRIEGSARRR